MFHKPYELSLYKRCTYSLTSIPSLSSIPRCKTVSKIESYPSVLKTPYSRVLRKKSSCLCYTHPIPTLKGDFGLTYFFTPCGVHSIQMSFVRQVNPPPSLSLRRNSRRHDGLSPGPHSFTISLQESVSYDEVLLIRTFDLHLKTKEEEIG